MSCGESIWGHPMSGLKEGAGHGTVPQAFHSDRPSRQSMIQIFKRTLSGKKTFSQKRSFKNLSSQKRSFKIRIFQYIFGQFRLSRQHHLQIPKSALNYFFSSSARHHMQRVSGGLLYISSLRSLFMCAPGSFCLISVGFLDFFQKLNRCRFSSIFYSLYTTIFIRCRLLFFVDKKQWYLSPAGQIKSPESTQGLLALWQYDF